MEITDEMLKAARMGPYQELAWQLKFDLKPELSESQKSHFIDDFASFADKKQLGLAGQLGDFVVVSIVNRKAVTVEEQQLLKGWLTKRSEILLDHENVGDGYTDAWYEQLRQYQEPQTDTFAKFFS
jgi:uncharacterized protein YggL (DUF469 family)